MSRSMWLVAVLIAVAAAIAVVMWRDAADRETSETSPEPVAVTVAGRALSIPRNAIRFAAQRRAGPRDRLDLALVLPEWSGRTDATSARFDVVGRPPDVVWLTIEPSRDGIDAAARLATVYSRLFVGDPREGPNGLVGRGLSPKAGYVDEEGWFEPGVVRPFVARCWPPAPGEEADVCLHDMVVAGVAVGLRFPKSMLADWPRLREGLRARLAEWGLAPPP